ncbi:FMN-dependent NADH-azoreductase [Bradyrhizobium guangzhouense]|uniref:FMN dependent NADH:quinone oxidoreductase n=1 Tax=Bradyrhizobium guangzhouense TaxID=1325095 RepID=A0AAE5WZ04_9BRAD|nr:NAD(P)H-dependent oxidoreductase [Bradyrhizobium guangzhouense]QAU45666.1 FMN-dependent NADH-azoreductase [Bradyrhizobium guangzhouense]
MSKLLYIKASPRGSASKSSAVADVYVATLRDRLPDLVVDTLDLAQERLPEFDGDKVAAKMAVIAGQAHEGRQKTAWDEITAVANRFISADRYLIAAPMWNGGIPYRLKQYIDVIHQPGLLWGLDPQTGYFGLLKNKKAVLALTSGAFGPSMPSPAFGVDHHSTYLRDWLNQAGVTDIEEIRFQPTLLNPDPEGSFDAAAAVAQFFAARA